MRQSPATQSSGLDLWGAMVAKVLDTFGEFVVAKLRDAVIDHADMLLAAQGKAPTLQRLQSDLSKLSTEQRAVVRRCVTEAIDSGLHDFLFALQEEHDAGGDVSVMVSGESVAAASDGLQGELFSADGWFARFSKHGAHPDSA